MIHSTQRESQIRNTVIMERNKNILLMESCWDGDIEKAKQLISAGANLNYQDRRGVTPLMLASASGHLELVKYLTEQGADISAGDYEKGWDALAYASLNNQSEVWNYLRCLKFPN